MIDVINLEGEVIGRRPKPNNALENKELQRLISHIVTEDQKKHYKYCPCCRNYD
jgi:hypothetical protein